MVTLIYFALLVVGFFFLVIRPQRARANAARALQSELAPGATIVTTSGLHGTVTDVSDDTVGLEIAPGVVVRFAKAAIGRIAQPVKPVDGSADTTTDTSTDATTGTVDPSDSVDQDAPRT